MTDRDRLSERSAWLREQASFLEAKNHGTPVPWLIGVLQEDADEMEVAAHALQDCEREQRNSNRDVARERYRAEAAEQRVKELEYECAGRAEQMSIEYEENQYLKKCIDEHMQRVKELEGVMGMIAGGEYNDTAEDLAAKTLLSSPNRLAASPPLVEEAS